MDFASLASSLGLEWKLFLFQLFNALIVLFLLKKFAFKPIMKIVEEREAFAHSAQQKMEQAQKLEQDAETQASLLHEQAKNEYQAFLTKAQEDAKTRYDKIIAEAESEAQHHKDIILSQAQNEAYQLKQNATQEMKETILQATQKLVKHEVAKQKTYQHIDTLLTPRV